MNKYWLKFAKTIDAKSVRERSMLFLLATVGVFLVANMFLIEPLWKKQKALTARNLEDKNLISAAQIEIAQRMVDNSMDPDTEIKGNIKAAQKRLQTVEAELQQLSKNLVRADDMDALLESILRRNKTLRLSSFKSLPVVNLMPSNGASATPEASPKLSDVSGALLTHIEERGIYKHEVELVLQGNYLDMLNYMRELEALPEHVFWSRSTFTTLEYPKARLNLNLYTLSLENKWLNL